MYFCSKSTKDFALLKSRFPPKLCLYHSLTSQLSKIAIPPILKTRYFKRPFYSFQAEACSKTFDQIFVSELPRFCCERGRKLPSRPFSFEQNHQKRHRLWRRQHFARQNVGKCSKKSRKCSNKRPRKSEAEPNSNFYRSFRPDVCRSIFDHFLQNCRLLEGVGRQFDCFCRRIRQSCRLRIILDAADGTLPEVLATAFNNEILPEWRGKGICIFIQAGFYKFRSFIFTQFAFLLRECSNHGIQNIHEASMSKHLGRTLKIYNASCSTQMLVHGGLMIILFARSFTNSFFWVKVFFHRH